MPSPHLDAVVLVVGCGTVLARGPVGAGACRAQLITTAPALSARVGVAGAGQMDRAGIRNGWTVVSSNRDDGFAIYPMVEEAEATGVVAGVYAELLSRMRMPFVPSLFKSLAVCPPYLVLAYEQCEGVLTVAC